MGAPSAPTRLPPLLIWPYTVSVGGIRNSYSRAGQTIGCVPAVWLLRLLLLFSSDCLLACPSDMRTVMDADACKLTPGARGMCVFSGHANELQTATESSTRNDRGAFYWDLTAVRWTTQKRGGPADMMTDRVPVLKSTANSSPSLPETIE